MTGQVMEVLRHQGLEHVLLGTPLDRCRDPGVSERRKLLRMPSTAERRGYCGTWQINDERLWLVGLGAYVYDPAKDAAEWFDDAQGLAWLFPDHPTPVPAEWFTGEIQQVHVAICQSTLTLEIEGSVDG